MLLLSRRAYFDHSLGDVSNQRPDIHIRNPRNSRDQVIIDGDDFEEIVADAGNNADLYAANQGSTELINETYTEEVPLRFMGQDVLYHQPLSLD